LPERRELAVSFTGEQSGEHRAESSPREMGSSSLPDRRTREKQPPRFRLARVEAAHHAVLVGEYRKGYTKAGYIEIGESIKRGLYPQGGTQRIARGGLWDSGEPQ
jgi:hypothetical protein